MSNRIKEYLPKLIHHNQSGYVKNGNITDTIRTIQDIIEFTEIHKLHGIDFEKAFDTLEWKFILKWLKFYNFGNNFF